MVRPYQDSDFEELASWGKAWGAEYDKDLFPPTGFIVPGVCAYFIYETNSKVCWLENMVCNPVVDKEVREKSLEQVVSAVLKEVNKLGYKVAYASTNNQAVIARATRHGAYAESTTQLTLKFKK